MPAKKTTAKTVKKTVGADQEVKAAAGTVAAEKNVKKAASGKTAAKKTATKKTPAKKTAKKVADTMIAAEAADGKKVYEGVETIQDAEEVKVERASENAAIQEIGAEAAAGQHVFEGIEKIQSSSKKKAAKSKVQSKAIDKIAQEAADGKQVFEGVETIQTAQEVKDQKANETAALKEISAEGDAGARVFAGIEKMAKSGKGKKGKSSAAEQMIAKESADGKAVFEGENAVEQTVVSEEKQVSDQKAIDAISTEANDGVAVFEGTENVGKKPAKKKTVRKTTAKKATKSASRKSAEAAIAQEAKDGTNVFAGTEQLAAKEAEKQAAALPESIKERAISEDSQAAEKVTTSDTSENVRKTLEAESAAGVKVFTGTQTMKTSPETVEDSGMIRADAAAAAKGDAVKKVEYTQTEADLAERENLKAQSAKGVDVQKGNPTDTGTEEAEGQSGPFMEATSEKFDFYNTFPVETLLEMAQTLGLKKDIEGLKEELKSAPDLKKATEEIILNEINPKHGYTFEEDGFDETVVPYLMAKVAESLPYRAEDQEVFAQKITHDIDRILINEGMNDSAVYKDLLEDLRQILVYGQKNNISTVAEIEAVIPADVKGLINRTMDVAYTILPGWQYNDVKYYEGFIYGVLSQFEDLANLHNRAMMDVADLYILHGDYAKGDADYNYILRENQLKDQIYYRFAKVYQPFDRLKAKSIAGSALRFVDDRYDYYPKIIEILNS